MATGERPTLYSEDPDALAAEPVEDIPETVEGKLALLEQIGVEQAAHAQAVGYLNSRAFRIKRALERQMESEPLRWVQRPPRGYRVTLRLYRVGGA